MPLPHPQAGVWVGGSPSCSGPPQAAGRQRPPLGTRGRPCPARPTRARPAAAGFLQPGRPRAPPGRALGRGAAGRGAETLSGASGHRVVLAEARGPFPEQGLSPKAGRRAGACTRTQRSVLDFTAPCPLSLPGCPRGSSRSGLAQATAPGSGRPPRVAPGLCEGAGGRWALTRLGWTPAVAPGTGTLRVPFVNGGKGPPPRSENGQPGFSGLRALNNRLGAVGSSSGPHPAEL